MSMSKQDFELVADVIAASIEGCREVEAEPLPLVIFTHLLAEELAKVHPRFDTGRFLKAANVPPLH